MSKRGKHQSFDKELSRVMRWLDSCAEVKRVVIGRMEPCRHKFTPGKVSVTSATRDGGIRLTGYTGRGVVALYIRVVPPETVWAVSQAIKARFGSV